MKISNALSTLRVVIVAFGMIVAFGIPTFGQEAPLQKEASAPTPAPVMNEVLRHNIEDWVLQGRGIPEDWSHHHLVFSNPGTEEDAIANGTHDRWLNIVNDPRYIIQQLKRRAAQGPAAADAASIEQTAQAENAASAETIAATQDPTPAAKSKKSKMKKDWSEPLGSGAAATLTGVVGTLNSSSISGSSTLTVDSVTFDASAPTSATQTGTFSAGAPGAGQTAAITNGTNVLTLTTNATTASAIGTVSGLPTSTTAPAITITNSAGASSNTLTLTTNATASHATGTFSGQGPTVGQTMTIKNSLNSNTLTLTTAGATGTATITTDPSTGNTITIGAIVYAFHGSFIGCILVSNCIYHSGNTTQDAENLSAAINNNSALCGAITSGSCFFNLSGANASVTAAATATNVVTVTNITSGTVPWSRSNSGSITLSPTATIAAPTGTNGCTSLTAGTFVINASTASNLATAINSTSCQTTYPVGVTASVAGSVVTVTNATLGLTPTLTLAESLTNFAWSGVTAGTNGSNACTSSTTGTFATSTTAALVAANIAAAIGSTSCQSTFPVGVTVAYTSGDTTFTVTNPTPGPFLAVSGSNLANLFSWGTVSGGSAGTTACTSTTAGTYATSASASTLATNFASVIASCNTTYPAVGVTASATGSSGVVTLTADTAGTGGNSIALTKSLSDFAWTGATLTGGADGTTSGTPPKFAYWSVNTYLSSASVATNIATAVNANPTVSAVITATANSPASGDVTFTAKSVGPSGDSYSVAETNFSAFTGTGNLLGGVATVQPNMYPATYVASLTGASCSDFAVYPTGQAGSSTAANIIAYDNLYATGAGAPCSGGPSVYWAYNTGAYAVTTSPILSVDGKQIAFIESNGTTASLVLIKWASETGESVTAPLTLTNSGSASAYRSCTPTAIAPCMFTIAFANGQNDTLSAPFYDFAGSDDVLYVGDDSGNLHKFTGVFVGNPGESGNPWTNLGSNKLSSPVYDSNSAHIFVGDMGGTLHSVTATGSPFGSAALGDAIADAPMVDGSAGSLYAFVTTSTNPAVFNGDNVVFEFSTGFNAYGTPGVVAVGTGGAGLGYYLYAGDFDNVYYESSSPPAGSLYVVGNTGATTGGILYRIPISGGGMTGSIAGPTITAAAHPWPSPATEFCNNGTSACAVTTGGSCGAGNTCTTSGTDYLFFSVNRGTGTGCTSTAGHGCILSYNISKPSAVSQAGNGLNVTTPGTPGCWATGGILPDNSAATTGASQIYFVNLNGAAAGGAGGGTPTSTNCTAGAGPTIQATQAQQSSP